MKLKVNLITVLVAIELNITYFSHVNLKVKHNNSSFVYSNKPVCFGPSHYISLSNFPITPSLYSCVHVKVILWSEILRQSTLKNLDT